MEGNFVLSLVVPIRSSIEGFVQQDLQNRITSRRENVFISLIAT